MIYAILLVGLAALCGASNYYKYTNACFQCEYRPARTRTFKVPVQEEVEYKVPKTTYECKEEKPYYPPRQLGPHGHRQGYGLAHPFTHGSRRRCYPKVEYEVRKGYKTKYEERSEKTPAGGFDACMGPITSDSAKKDGVDAWKCDSNCYTRIDAYGNVNRGCYKGEFGVNPKLLGCHYQAGQRYCFCHGDYCNGDLAKS